MNTVINISDAKDLFLEYCRSKQRTSATVNWYQRDLKPFIEFIGPAKSIDAIDRYIAFASVQMI
jgi:hypothetical protein